MFTANLDEILNENDEEEVKDFLCHFSCPKNKDLEFFLCNSSIEFSKRNVSKTYLIIDNEDDPKILAYFSLTFTTISTDNFELSKNQIKQMDGFSKNAKNIKFYLIGQIGKNFSVNDNPIDLELILQETFTILKKVRSMTGGRFALLECNNNPALIALYESKGFKVSATNEDNDHLVTMCIKIPE